MEFGKIITIDGGVALTMERCFVVGQRHNQCMCHSECDNTKNTKLADVHGVVL